MLLFHPGHDQPWADPGILIGKGGMHSPPPPDANTEGAKPGRWGGGDLGVLTRLFLYLFLCTGYLILIIYFIFYLLYNILYLLFSTFVYSLLINSMVLKKQYNNSVVLGKNTPVFECI